MALKLVVFDLDGTLASTGADLADAVNELRAGLGLRRKPPAAIAACVGQGARHLLRHTLPEVLGPDPAGMPALYRRFLRLYGRRCLRRTRLYPGVRRALAALRGPTLVVLTNKPGRLSRRILKGLGVAGRFRAVVGGDEMRKRKPHPAAILDLMRRFRARPSETVVVGDSRFDMEAGRRAHALLCGVTWGFGRRRELARWRPDAMVTRAANLPAALRRLGR
ncbi:MAG: HAD-IA family hydrolase [Candidatus Coatesbacteria bacterium]